MSAREVVLTGGSPWGFRMHGGSDVNQPLKISRVNPGRKAALGGIREGDVITSINGQPTKEMTNAEAQNMLKQSGSTLRLGLNEHRTDSSRRSSFTKGTSPFELKRPSQLVNDFQNGDPVPHPPVYSSIKTRESPFRTLPSPKKTTLNSLPNLNPTDLVKQIVTNETPKYQPTNPFYSTLPPETKLTNGTSDYSSLDRPSRYINGVKFQDKINKSYDFYSSDTNNFTEIIVNFDHDINTHNAKPYKSFNDCSFTKNLDNLNRKRDASTTARNIVEPECLSKEDIYHETQLLNSNKKPFSEMYNNQRDKSSSQNETKYNNNVIKLKSNNPFSEYLSYKDDYRIENTTPGIVIEKTTISEEKFSEIEEIRTIKKVVLNGTESNAAARKDAKINTSLLNGHHNEQTVSKNNQIYGRVPEIVVDTGDGVQAAKPSLKAQSSTRPTYFKAYDKGYSNTEEPSYDRYKSKTVMIGPTFKATSPAPAVWTPGQTTNSTQTSSAPPFASLAQEKSPPAPPPPPPQPIWTPSSAGPSPLSSRKQFKPVTFDDVNKKCEEPKRTNSVTEPPKQNGFVPRDPPPPPRLPTSHSVPTDGFSSLSNRLPKAQNPTITLLQKAREGQLPRGASYIQEQQQRAREERTQSSSSSSGWRSSGYASEPEGGSRSMSIARTRVDGIGPTTKDGMPVALRSEVRDPSKWYRKMYDTIHKNKYDDNHIKVHYKSPRASPSVHTSSRSSNYTGFETKSGYLSEPEGNTRRRRVSSNDAHTDSELSPYLPSEKYSTLASARAHQEVYRNQPGRIENYVPGKSSVVEKESKQWWDEVMDIFDGWLDDNSPIPDYPAFLARALRRNDLTKSSSHPVKTQKESITSSILSKSNMARALKDGGYESDSTLVFRRRGEDSPLSPRERSQAYRAMQAGGEPPLKGFRSPAPQPDDTEIEYIPLSPTLTKIRVHKKSSRKQEIICYPNQPKIQKYAPSFIGINIQSDSKNPPPSPPRRISSKHNLTLKSCNKKSTQPNMLKRNSKEKSNVDILRDKITSKLNKDTLTTVKRCSPPKNMKMRSTNTIKNKSSIRGVTVLKSGPNKPGTSSFASPRNTTPPVTYAQPSFCRFNRQDASKLIIPGGAGRKTPITNILDKVTSIDKMWNEERSQTKAKTTNKINKSESMPKINTTREKQKIEPSTLNTGTKKHNISNLTVSRGRTLQRTCDKVINMKKEPILKVANSKITNDKTVLKSIIKDNKNIKSAALINLRQKNENRQSLNEGKMGLKVSLNNKSYKEQGKITSTNKSLPNAQVDLDIFDDDCDIQKSYKVHEYFCDQEIYHHQPMKTINSYLINTKPVSKSKFLFWDRYGDVYKKTSPRSHSWPDQISQPAKPQYCESLSVSTVRSKSEPPIKKFYFSQTSRPKSPVVLFHRKNKFHRNTPSLPKLYFSQTTRPISPALRFSQNSSVTSTRSHSLSPTKFNSFSTNEDMEAQFSRESSPSKLFFTETSRPVSPKIYKNHDYHQEESKYMRSPSSRRIQSLQTAKRPHQIVFRTYSPRARSAGDADTKNEKTDQNKRSHSHIHVNELKSEIENFESHIPKTQCEKFRELSKYYRYLERIGELEKSTSLVHRQRNKNVIDFDKWKKIRSVERAEEELEKLHILIRQAEKENDFHFHSDSLKKMKWHYASDPGLKVRDKSVEDLRIKFQDLELNSSAYRKKGVNNNFKTALYKKEQDNIDSDLTELGQKIGFSNNLWSSLTSEQVTKLKHQLNEIYGKEVEDKRNEEYSISVSKQKVSETPSLKVRSNSYPAVVFKETIYPDKFNSLDRLQLKNKTKQYLSETEKRQISKSISTEVMNRIAKLKNQSILENVGQTYKDEERASMATSHSETEETESSDTSTKTVIYQNKIINDGVPDKEVKKKVQYFETVNSEIRHSPTVYQPCEESETSDDGNNSNITDEKKQTLSYQTQKAKDVYSSSCSNFKELFGETNLHSYTSLPIKSTSQTQATNMCSEAGVTRSVSQFNERANQSRSNSPDPEKYWRAYVCLTRSGEVDRLTKRFESSNLRRHKSDPELARRVLYQEWPYIKRLNGPSVDELAFRYESRSKLRRKAISPTPLRNRFMPHIDVISKTAALKRRASVSNPSESVEVRSGEVQRLRSIFENNAHANGLTYSAPDVRYLSGCWVAHKFPRKKDNNRSPASGNFVSGRISPVRRPRSTPISARSEWNPEAHRPVARYVPPRPSVSFQDPDYAPTPPIKGISNGYFRYPESPRRQYVESDVNIHYKCPVRRDPLPHVPEKELARAQAEHMRRVYQEERRRKYLQELQDLQNRRHTDNFTPSQKTIVPLNRYDDAPVNAGSRTKARVLYDFASQTPRELNLKKNDIVMIRRQIDANWYEGEHNGKVGLFPYNYVEIIKTGVTESKPSQPKAVAHEGRARAKFDFIAQTNLELPLRKGELVVLIRRVDENWWEGRLGNKIGIFPDSYIQVLDEPSGGGKVEPIKKPVASPASHGLMNGSARSSMGPHSYTPQLNSPALSNAPQPNQPLTTSTSSVYKRMTERSITKSPAPNDINNHKPLYIDTNAETIPYRAMYKYKPQNPDELELLEGDTVYVVEKCDDGWYVGTSKRTQRFGTFPGNYVERIA